MKRQFTKKLILTILLSLFGNAYATDITIHNAWIKAKKGVMTGAFLDIKNNTGKDDKLIAVKTNFAKKNEIHAVNIDSNGNAKMVKIDYIAIPKNKTTQLKSGNYHLMFMGLKQNIKPHNKYNITLIFEKYGELKIKIPVKKKGNPHNH